MNASSKAKDIFLAALDLKSPAAKQAYLDSACADDQALRLEVEEMLVHHEKLGSFLQSPIIDISPTIDQAPSEGPGTLIGPYKLLQEIGHGGMGVVFMAEQHQPVKRRVALKIIKPGMDSRQVIARFEAERQALSLMDHPNIAKVLDAGTTSSGRPYFVMELVKGQPITKYCDEHHMTPRQRLELLLPVCQAIQHAHQKGIIHRDIKPSNILVAEYDNKPVPKVIDFGVAKAIHQPLTDKTMFTGFGNIVGTLEYMSPEQANINQLDIDTRSDIYSLGVLMYELLTGSTPFDRKRLKQAAWDDMLRIIREEDPPKPSTRLSDSIESLPSISAQRHTEPAKLTRMVRGEIDWIVMKALDKDRNRRYETANGFAMDLLRYLADEAVQACPPSAGYRLRKYVWRNRGPVLAATLIFTALLAGIIGTTIGLLKAQNERDEKEIALHKATENETKAIASATEERLAKQAEAEQRKQAEAVANVLESLFWSLDPNAVLAGSLRIEMVRGLDNAAATLDKNYAGEPLVRARLRNAIGKAQLALGEPSKAMILFQQSHQERQERLGPDHPETLSSANNLAVAYIENGNISNGVRLYEETLNRRIAILGSDHDDTLTTKNNLGLAYLNAGKPDKALSLLESVFAQRRKVLGANHPNTLNVMLNLGGAYSESKQFEKAIQHFLELIKISQTVWGVDDVRILQSKHNLAAAYLHVRDADKAIPLLEETLRIRRIKLGLSHPSTLSSMNVLAAAYEAAGAFQKALPLFEETLQQKQDKLGIDHPDTQVTMNNLAFTYLKAGQYEKAIPLYESTLKIRRAQLEPNHPKLEISLGNLASAYLKSEQYAQAEPLYVELLELRKKKLGAEHPTTAETLVLCGVTLLQQKKYRDAETPLRASLTLFKKAQPDRWTTFDNRSMLGEALAGQQKYSEAEPLLLLGHEGLHKHVEDIPPNQKDRRIIQSLQRLVGLYDAWGKREEADKWRKQLDSMKAGAKKP